MREWDWERFIPKIPSPKIKGKQIWESVSMLENFTGDFMELIPTEHQEQVCIFQWAELNKNKYPELDLMFAIPNGGIRDKRTASKLKREGVKSGVSDVFIPCSKHGFYGLFLELKIRDAKKAKVSKEQKQFIEAVQKQGYKAIVCYGAEEAVMEIENYLA